MSVGTGGTQATGGSGFQGFSSDFRGSVIGGFSRDGRYISFTSEATNLVAGDTNGVPDVFLLDRVTGQTTRVSVGLNGQQANSPAISTAPPSTPQSTASEREPEHCTSHRHPRCSSTASR